MLKALKKNRGDAPRRIAVTESDDRDERAFERTDTTLSQEGYDRPKSGNAAKRLRSAVGGNPLKSLTNKFQSKTKVQKLDDDDGIEVYDDDGFGDDGYPNPSYDDDDVIDEYPPDRDGHRLDMPERENSETMQYINRVNNRNTNRRANFNVLDNYFNSMGNGASNFRPGTADSDMSSVPPPEGFGSKKFNPEDAVIGIRNEKDAGPFWKKQTPGFGKKGKGKGPGMHGPVISADVTHEKQPFAGGAMVEVRDGKRFHTKMGRATPMPEEEIIERVSQMDRKNPTIQFATMKYSRKARYSETYCVWTTDEHLLNELPPPHPPYTRKHEIFDPLAYRHIDRKKRRLPKKVVNYPLSEMVDHLIYKCHDDMSKLRAIYVWLTSLNIPRLKLPIKPTREGTAINYIEKLKKKKGNYAQLISHMCNLAGLPTVVVHGYLKGSTYDIGKPMKPETHYGEWNAVLVDNNWRFINAFWGACSVGSDIEESDVTTYKCDENFFLTDPEQLAYTHYPMEPKWQLLDPPMTLEDFETKAYLKERFFELEMRVLSHPRCEVQVENGEMDMLFGLNPQRVENLRFMVLVYMKEDKGHTLLYDDENRYQQDYICYNADSVTMKVRFPKAGTYRVEIVGKDTTIEDPKYDFDWVAIYKVNVNSGPVKYSAFPKCAEAGWGNTDTLKELDLIPATKIESGILLADDGYTRIAFKFGTPAARDVLLTHKLVDVNRGLDEVKMEKHGFEIFQDEEFLLKINLPVGDELAFCLFTRVEDDTYGSIEKNLCNYLIQSIPARQLDKTTNKVVFDGKTTLNDALHFKQLELIERAVDLVETRRHEGHMMKELNEAKELAQRLRKVSQLMHDVLALNQKLISELRSYNHPPPEIHDIMKATFLLLGNWEEETRDWKMCQVLLGRTGRQSLKRRINMFDINHCKLEVALGAKFLIGDIDFDQVQSVSRGAATFYTWTTGIVDEVIKRKPDQVEKTKPRISSDPKNRVPLTRLPRSVEIEIEEEQEEEDDDEPKQQGFWSKLVSLFRRGE